MTNSTDDTWEYQSTENDDTLELDGTLYEEWCVEDDNTDYGPGDYEYTE